MSLWSRLVSLVRPSERRCDWCRATYRPAQAATESRGRFCTEACAVEDADFTAW
ncbi:MULTISPECIES: hypothetical protein [unclassified Micrococcus]|uniref:hypothetical protein n=1 Tax=unclassified Micrococcus TaxID=2620948 RepID=UPI000B2F58FE|nr:MULTISPECIES: hypothetical protein [unclassified Micrococcus]